MTPSRVVPVAALLLVAAAAVSLPVAGHGGRPITKQGTFGPYNVTYHSAKGLEGGELLNVGWRVTDEETGANYTENTTANFTFRDADDRTIAESRINTTRFRETAFLVSYVRIAKGARAIDAALDLPNATATFSQSLDVPDGGDDRGSSEGESTPLPAAVVVTALAAAWWLGRR